LQAWHTTKERAILAAHGDRVWVMSKGNIQFFERFFSVVFIIWGIAFTVTCILMILNLKG
jgi:hypothetical protein